MHGPEDATAGRVRQIARQRRQPHASSHVARMSFQTAGQEARTAASHALPPLPGPHPLPHPPPLGAGQDSNPPKRVRGDGRPVSCVDPPVCVTDRRLAVTRGGRGGDGVKAVILKTLAFWPPCRCCDVFAVRFLCVNVGSLSPLSLYRRCSFLCPLSHSGYRCLYLIQNVRCITSCVVFTTANVKAFIIAAI